MRPGEEAAGSHLAIVDAGVDPEWAAAQVAASAFAGAGQSCGSVERVHVHRARRRAVPRCAGRPRARAEGRPGDGPRHRARPADRRRPPACGSTGRSRTPSTPAPTCWPAASRCTAPGFFYPPTVLAGAPDDALVICGETRGPVVDVRVADSFADALRARADRARQRPHALARQRPARLARTPGPHRQRQRRLPRRAARPRSPSCSTPSPAPKSSTSCRRESPRVT